MPSFKTFKEIKAWQQARELTTTIYSITNVGSFAKDFGLRDQLRRASVSIMANIAEGFERSGTGEFVHFLSMAKGSSGEVESHLCVALDLGYIDKATFNRCSSAACETCTTDRRAHCNISVDQASKEETTNSSSLVQTVLSFEFRVSG